MKRRYTVVWGQAALHSLANLWLDNPAIRKEITGAANDADHVLSYDPDLLQGSVSGRSRVVPVPPLLILLRVVEEDRQVRVLHVKLWDD